METKYPDHTTYEALYARYLERGVDEILGALPKITGTSILDLCGGNGRLSRALLNRGAKRVKLVDAERNMVSDHLLQELNFRFICGDVHGILGHLYAYTRELFDHVVCQQAINYWLDGAGAQAVSRVLHPGGVFVFNTFNEKPPETPHVKQYAHEGHSFVETAWCIGDVVHHVQVRDGMQPHYTTFSWISPDQYRKMLEPYFVVEEKRNGRSSLYSCYKK